MPLDPGNKYSEGEYFEDTMGEHGIWNFLWWMLTQQTDFPCTLLADSDLHFDPTWLTDRQCAVGIGHNEYWSLDMREQLQTHL